MISRLIQIVAHYERRLHRVLLRLLLMLLEILILLLLAEQLVLGLAHGLVFEFEELVVVIIEVGLGGRRYLQHASMMVDALVLDSVDC